MDLVKHVTSATAFVQRARARYSHVFSQSNAVALSKLFAEFHVMLWKETVYFRPTVSEKLKEILNDTNPVGLPGTLACARMIVYIFMIFGYMRTRISARGIIEEFLT